MYAVTDYKRNCLLFVFPSPKYRLDGSPFPILTADHFSVPYCPKQPNQIQLHITKYMPTGITGKEGEVSHKPNHFKDNIPYEKIPFRPLLKQYKDSLLELLNPTQFISGGGLTKRKSNPPSTPQRKKRSRKTSFLQEHAEEICQKWAKNKIEHIMVFVQKRGDTFDCTCLVYDKLRRKVDETFEGCAFALPKVNESVLREHVLQFVCELP
jgi:hypothetical protein